MKLGDVSVKEFGKKGDFLIKVEEKFNDNKEVSEKIKINLQQSLNTEIDFRRVENVGPKVSQELLKNGIIAISCAVFCESTYALIDC